MLKSVYQKLKLKIFNSMYFSMHRDDIFSLNIPESYLKDNTLFTAYFLDKHVGTYARLKCIETESFYGNIFVLDGIGTLGSDDTVVRNYNMSALFECPILVCCGTTDEHYTTATPNFYATTMRYQWGWSNELPNPIHHKLWTAKNAKKGWLKVLRKDGYHLDIQ